ncbi:MAG: glycoside hydrolase family 2 protein [Bacilli bacterium]|nr:glycoside hydrolase family 2 protein [Bacilli bacterium]
MRQIININEGWKYFKDVVEHDALAGKEGEAISIPHTWNGYDGQDGGGDYWRGSCWYVKPFAKPSIKSGQRVYIECKGVNSTGEVWVNGKMAGKHDGGYSTFRVDVTDLLEDSNELAIRCDNSPSEIVYPQTADFTFYGGVYRDVNVIIVEENHFDLDYYGGIGAKIDSTVKDDNGILKVEGYVKGEGEVAITLKDAEGNVVASGANLEEITVPNAHLWQGRKDPYLYEVSIDLKVNGEVVDNITKKIGFRTFVMDPKRGFILNGIETPLRGVAKHQDRRDLGNAVSPADQMEDMEIINDMGVNTIRLSHYQHDDIVYDLCDKYGFIVWAEIPYISRHMAEEGNKNLEDQMKELIVQNYHHPSIICWGISNEITMMQKGVKKNMLKEQHSLNDLGHEMDPSRLTTIACFSMCGPFSKIAKITDITSWNLYFGWYFPGLFVNDIWFGIYHMFHKKRCVGLSEYGAEGMTNLHSAKPHRGDSTEEYHAIYHEYMLKFFEKRNYLWATHVWNMFDFGSDGRTHGGDNGVNHKGLVTFDHKTKKDAYYIYQAYFAEKPMVWITSKRFLNRTGKKTEVKVYSNQNEVELFVNGVSQGKKTGSHHVFKWKVAFPGDLEIKAVAGSVEDTSTIKHVDVADDSYVLHVKSNNYSWEKKDKDED